MPSLKLGESPCARAARDASAWEGDRSGYGNVTREGGNGKRSYRGEDTTEDKAEPVDMSIMVGVVLHGGWRGRFGGIVRLGSNGS
jgi:hypothetical protein